MIFDIITGALYTLIGHKDRTFVTKHDWTTIFKIWPSILLSRHSEKPSIAKLLDYLLSTLQTYLETFAIENHVSDSAVEKALFLIPEAQKPTSQALSESQARLLAKNAENVQKYEALVDVLCTELENRKFHWRHYNLGLVMLTLLTRKDRLLPSRAVKLMVNNLNHDNLMVRKCAIFIIGSILKQHKRPHPKIDLEETEKDEIVAPGDREGNLWLCYNSER